MVQLVSEGCVETVEPGPQMEPRRTLGSETGREAGWDEGRLAGDVDGQRGGWVPQEELMTGEIATCGKSWSLHPSSSSVSCECRIHVCETYSDKKSVFR